MISKAEGLSDASLDIPHSVYQLPGDLAANQEEVHHHLKGMEREVLRVSPSTRFSLLPSVAPFCCPGSVQSKVDNFVALQLFHVSLRPAALLDILH